MIVIPTFFQQALGTRLKDVEDPTLLANLTYATTYKRVADYSYIKRDFNSASYSKFPHQT